jgi:hypothetical protein
MLDAPALEQRVHERAAERVAGAQAVHHLARDRIDLDNAVGGPRQHSRRTPLDNRHRHAELEQQRRRFQRIVAANRDRHLLLIADRHRRVAQGLARPPPGRRVVVPEHRPVIEVVDRDRARCRIGTRAQGSERRVAARLRGEPGAGGPQHARGADRVEVELVDSERHVRRGRLAIEEDREIVGRMDLAEHDRRAKCRVHADVSRVDAEALEGLAHVDAELLRADLRDDGGTDTESRRRDGHVGGASAERAGERRDVLERHVDLLRVEIDADAAHRDQLKSLHPVASRSHCGYPTWSVPEARMPTLIMPPQTPNASGGTSATAAPLPTRR